MYPEKQEEQWWTWSTDRVTANRETRKMELPLVGAFRKKHRWHSRRCYNNHLSDLVTTESHWAQVKKCQCILEPVQWKPSWCGTIEACPSGRQTQRVSAHPQLPASGRRQQGAHQRAATSTASRAFTMKQTSHETNFSCNYRNKYQNKALTEKALSFFSF